ncbi:MAG: energy transducer TonB [Bacteroidales bacterium]|nr:energy transducer TonB [Bacteroidales bacterium]MBN2818379.1 energy transducer TonB [Bacteroidales bacterium]
MKHKTEHIDLFGPGGCITRKAIERYIDKELTDSEIKKLESHARHCRLCADALEGADYFSSGIQFQGRISKLSNTKWRRGIEAPIRNSRLLFGIAAAAASIALIIGINGIFRFNNLLMSKSEVADLIPENSQQVNVVYPAPNEKVLDESANSKGVTSITDVHQSLARPMPPEPKPQKEKLIVVEPDIEIEDVELEFSAESSYDEIAALKTLEIGGDEQEEEYLRALSTAEEDNQMKPVMAFNDKSANEPAEMEPVKMFSRSAQKTAKKEMKAAAQPVYYVAELMPMFNGGGIEKFSNYISDSINVLLPDSILRQSIVVAFRIDTAGKVDNVKLISGTDSEVLNKQVMKMIEDSPKWIPAYLSGTPVATDQQVEVVLGKKFQ